MFMKLLRVSQGMVCLKTLFAKVIDDRTTAVQNRPKVVKLKLHPSSPLLSNTRKAVNLDIMNSDRSVSILLLVLL